MARSSLTVDTEDLRSLFATLGEVKSAFESGRDCVDDADACGHAGLVQRVRSFSTGWDDTRRRLAEAIGDLGTSARGIADGFDDADAELAASLAGDD
ncbi:hypothetical protein ES689_08800 [Frigoribacterium sp. ACAM 257]|uniref:hypothetical protein n=1 Tax=Frigoribacterium sp. ACAM 257 TaxID=2508998 RepID=UPI0011BA0262|nr:hypothetical protein [Frigoribacterium sp. ACAM 257]TWX38701.1 hypothetical protein ES689_08800 [Frigoribacterium sp. ACAM 257]